MGEVTFEATEVCQIEGHTERSDHHMVLLHFIYRRKLEASPARKMTVNSTCVHSNPGQQFVTGPAIRAFCTIEDKERPDHNDVVESQLGYAEVITKTVSNLDLIVF